MATLRETQETGAQAPESRRRDRRHRPRIVIPLADDGRPELDSLEPETAELLRAELAAAEPAEPVSPAVVQFAVQALARIEGAIIGPRFGLPVEEAASIMLPPPELAGAISEAGARVLQKHAGVMGRYQDEIALAALIITWQAGAIGALRAAAAARAPQSAKSAEPASDRKPAAAETS